MKRFIVSLLILAGAVAWPVTAALSIHYTDTYPDIWKSVPRDSIVDSWDMGVRECTSYVAWMVHSNFQYSVYGWGNAKQWPLSAVRHNVSVSAEPSVHSVAVSQAGPQGHVMWVDSINADSTLHVSQYNAKGDGQYSESNIKTEGLSFITFPEVSNWSIHDSANLLR